MPRRAFQSGVRVLQQKVASIISELAPSSGPRMARWKRSYAPNSPSAAMQGMAGAGGYTPYGGGAGGGAASAWGGGTTPYGGTTQYGATTPYGQQNGGW